MTEFSRRALLGAPVLLSASTSPTVDHPMVSMGEITIEERPGKADPTYLLIYKGKRIGDMVVRDGLVNAYCHLLCIHSGEDNDPTYALPRIHAAAWLESAMAYASGHIGSWLE